MAEKVTNVRKRDSTTHGPLPKPAPGLPPGADMWAFHGHIMQRQYESSIERGRQRRPNFEGNKFGAQPPEKK